DVEQFRHLLHGREFLRQSPARFARAETQALLPVATIDLEDDAVDFVRQAVTTLADVAVVSEAFLYPTRKFEFAADGYAPLLQLLNQGRLRVGQARGGDADTVATEFERTRGGEPWIELTQAAGGGIAWIGETLLTGFECTCVEFLEALARHVDLAAHFETLGP